MTESISSSSVEGQCELEIKRAISLDIADQAQLDQNKISNKRSFFVAIQNLFIIIYEKTDCIGQLFIPSYIGYEKFQDTVRFNFFFRVRDSVGYDVSLMPPERLRKRFYKKLEGIKKEFENLVQQNQNSEKTPKKFACNIVIKEKKEEKVIASLESNFLNIYSEKDKDFIFIDKIDLSEPGVYVDGFRGFIEHPKNLIVLIYSDNQLRQMLSFDKKQLIESQNFMTAVAKSCARYCDQSQNPILKGLEIKNSESNDNINTDDETSSMIPKSSSIGINEFREEPKYTKFPQTMKQKMKRNIKSQIKIHKNLFDQSKLNLKEIHANQKQIKNQIHNSEKKEEETKQEKKEEEKNENDQNDEQDNLEQKNDSPKNKSNLFSSAKQISENYFSGSSSNEDNEDDQSTLSLATKGKSQLNLLQLHQQNNQETLIKSKSQPRLLDNQNSTDLKNKDQLQNSKNSKNLKKILPTPVKKVNSKNDNNEYENIPYFPDVDDVKQKTDNTEKPYKTEQMKMEENDLHQIQIITKSYLMINFRKKYFTEIKIPEGNNKKNDNKEEIKYKHEPINPEEYEPNENENIIEELKEYLINKEYENLIKKMMKDSDDIDAKCTKLIKLIFESKNYNNELIKETQDSILKNIIQSKSCTLNQLSRNFYDLDKKNKLYILLNEMFELTLKPDFENEEFLDTFQDTYFIDGDIIRELSNCYMAILDERKKL